MPVKLERALKRKASKMGLSKERKNAYVYGTMRKTGWKPSQEKKMNNPSKTTIEFGLKKPAFTGIANPTSPEVMKLHRKLFTDLDKLTGDPGITHKVLATAHKHNLAIRGLNKLSSRLDSIIQLEEEEDDRRGHPLLAGAAGVGVGAGGLAAHQAIRRSGGYAKNLLGARAGYGLERSGIGAATSAGSSLGYKAGALAGKGANVAGGAWKSILAKLGRTAAKALESKEKPIEFGAEILGPWHGKTGHTSKIDQLEFPAGLSPAAALKFPLPVLMRYMNQRNITQQVFSSKHEKLIELNAKFDEIKFISREEEEEVRPPYGREDTSGKTWKGGAVAAGIGVGGYGTYRSVKALQPGARYTAGKAAGKISAERWAKKIAKTGTQVGWKETGQLYGRVGKAFWKGARYAHLSAKIDDLINFDAGWGAFPTSASFTPGLGGSLRYVPTRKPGAGEHFKRSAGRYVGTGAGLATAAGIAALDLRSAAKAGIHHSEVLRHVPAAAATLAAGGLLGGAVVDQFRRSRGVRKAIGERIGDDVSRVAAASKK